MDVSGSSYSGAISLLNSANKQPELALQLLLKSMQTLQVAGGTQSLATGPEVAVSAPTATSGQNIDILA